MSAVALLGAFEVGLLFSLVALGTYVSFRILNFPDLTVDGSFPLGAAVAAILITRGVDPFAATAAAILAGSMAGVVTGLLNVRLRVLHILAGILVMTALFSINLRIMGRPNLALLNETTVFTGIETHLVRIGLPTNAAAPVALLLLIIVVKTALDTFLATHVGLALRAAGANARMARANGVADGAMVVAGLALSNGLVALAGALFAQSQGAADVTLGIGTIVTGLASVIIGEAVISARSVFWATLASVIGAILYRLFVAIALSIGALGLQAQDLNLITALLVTLAIVAPRLRGIHKEASNRAGMRANALRKKIVR